MLKRNLKPGEFDWVRYEYELEMEIIQDEEDNECRNLSLDDYLENNIHRCECGKLYSDLIVFDNQCDDCSTQELEWYSEDVRDIEDSYDAQKEWEDFNNEWN